jgi:hypothetical protein
MEFYKTRYARFCTAVLGFLALQRCKSRKALRTEVDSVRTALIDGTLKLPHAQ